MMRPSSITTDPICGIFRDKEGQQILNKRAKAMTDNYYDVKDGSKKSITCYPAGFNFDGRIKKFNTVIIKELDRIKKNMETELPKSSDEADTVLKKLMTKMKVQGKYQGADVRAEINQTTAISQKAKRLLRAHFKDSEFYNEKDVKSNIDEVSHNAEIDCIKDFLKTIKPQDSERNVYERVLSLFSNERGLLLHSLTTDAFLQVFVNEARQQRKKNYLGLGLTHLEEKIAKAFNLSRQELDRAANETISQLKRNGLTSPYRLNDIQHVIYQNKALHDDLKLKAKSHLQFNSRLDDKQISNALKLPNQELDNVLNEIVAELKCHGFSSPHQMNDIFYIINKNKTLKKDLNSKTKVQKLLNCEQLNVFLDDQMIYDALKLATFEHQTKFPGELDLLGIFPDLQLLFHVEVKSNQVENKTKDRNLKDAAEQMSRYAQHIGLRHGPILSDKWNYCKVAAIIPEVSRPESICSHCRTFILTDREMQDEKSMRSWWESLGMYNNNSQSPIVKEQCYQEFLNFFNRVVNLSSVGRKINVFNAWDEVEGENQQPVKAGHTSGSGIVRSIKDVLSRAHDAFKTIYFTPEQMSLLSPRNFFRVLLLADYGAGTNLY